MLPLATLMEEHLESQPHTHDTKHLNHLLKNRQLFMASLEMKTTFDVAKLIANVRDGTDLHGWLIEKMQDLPGIAESESCGLLHRHCG